MDYVQMYFASFFQNLYSLAPKVGSDHPYSTGRLISGITYVDDGYDIKVSIEAINQGHDYVIDVNEAINAQIVGRPRTKLEELNYHFIQRAIDQSAQLISEKVTWEGGTEFDLH